MVTLDQAGWVGTDAVLRTPPAVLCDLVEHAFILDLRHASHRSWMVLPDYCGHVIVHVDDDEPAPRAFLVGPRTSAIDVDVSSRSWTLGVRLTPGALSVLTGIPASDFLDASIPLGAVWGSAGERLDERLSASRSPDLLVAHLVAFLSGLASRARERDWCARGLTRLLTGGSPTVRVSDVAARIGMSERGLRARSTEHIGLPPKRVARTHRLFRAIDRARHVDSPEWASIATSTGFADQPHMTREFGALLGESPARFLERGRASTPRADSFKTGGVSLG